MHGVIERFFYLKRTGVEIKQALDIGAYRGEFTNILKSVWPSCNVQQFEADKRNEQYLQSDAVFEVLGDTERAVEFFTVDDNGWGSTTGASIFKENTDVYSTSKPIIRQMKQLDSFVTEPVDFIKIDTQGSELFILEGAKNLLKIKPRFILLECSYIHYNEGAPLISEIFNYMNKINYKPVDLINNSYLEDKLIQSDWLFETL